MNQHEEEKLIDVLLDIVNAIENGICDTDSMTALKQQILRLKLKD